MTKSTKNEADETIKNGFETLFYDSGEKESEGKYKDNKKEGKWTSWDSKGNIITQGSFKGGQKSGKWEESDRQSTFTGNYKSDKKEGKWTEIWLGEKQVEKYYSNGDSVRKIRFYIGSQNQKEYEINKKDRSFISWHKNNQKASEGFLKGHISNKGREGQWTYWYENGQLESKGSYEDGIETGKWTYWYDDGQKISEGSYKDRRRDGQWTYWYENGQIESKLNYRPDPLYFLDDQWSEERQNLSMHGMQEDWYENGQKIRELKFKNGQTRRPH